MIQELQKIITKHLDISFSRQTPLRSWVKPEPWTSLGVELKWKPLSRILERSLLQQHPPPPLRPSPSHLARITNLVYGEFNPSSYVDYVLSKQFKRQKMYATSLNLCFP